MTFQIYFPPQASTQSVPVVYWLSGLTCTDENFIIKSGAQRSAAEYGLALIVPDTSPRGLNIPGENDAFDFGVGAGFYLNATKEPWTGNWHMYDYVTKELPDLIQKQCSNLDLSNAAIMGHSMGGHGALTVALKNPTRFKSLSVFSPISNPMKVPWGQKAFSGYLGDNQEDWKQYDACELLKKYEGPQIPWLVDTGTADQYLDIQLHPWTLEKICKEKNYPAVFRMQEGYDHSYFFIQSFIQKHLLHHAKVLGAVKSE